MKVTLELLTPSTVNLLAVDTGLVCELLQNGR